jgi:hypothetical protein
MRYWCRCRAGELNVRRLALRRRSDVRVINVLDDADDMIAPLRALTADSDHLAADRGRWLMRLVEHLQAQGSESAVCAMLLGDGRLLMYPTQPDPHSVWIEVELPEQDPAHRLLAPRYSWQVKHGQAGLLHSAAGSEPAEVERVITEAFGWPGR